MEVGILLGLVAVAGILFYLAYKEEKGSPYYVLFLLMGFILILTAVFSMGFLAKNAGSDLVNNSTTTYEYANTTHWEYNGTGDYVGHTDIPTLANTTVIHHYSVDQYGEYYNLLNVVYEVMLYLFLFVFFIVLVGIVVRVATDTQRSSELREV